MTLIRTLKATFASRTDSEHEQAILRIVIVGLILAYMGVFESPREGWNDHEITLVLGLCVFFTIALAIFVCICMWPATNVARRILGMLSDTGGATFYMCLAGEYGVSMIAVYLFVTFGNGFRFGRRYLFICQLLCLAGLTSVIAFVPYWQGHRPAGIGLLIAMIVLPLYVSTLLKRIHEAMAKAEEANRAKTAFLANMSHEMRTPLNGVVGLVDLLNATTLTKQQRELMRLLRHSVSVLRSLVDDVLDISKIEAGRLSIEIVAFDLHSTINGLVQLLRPYANAKGLSFHALIDPDVDYRVLGDPHHLRQVLLNLLGNAIKFTDRGEVTLSISLVKESTDGMTVRFDVRDTGIGIPSDALAKIFERFVQADQSTTRRFGGTGLGTTIAKQLVELMGGMIGVESVQGQGSCFWFEVPLLRDASATIDEVPASSTDEPSLVLVVADPPKASDIFALVQSTRKRVEIASPSTPIGTKIDSLIESGARIDAVIVAASVDIACAAFTAAAQRLTEYPVALLLIADEPLTVVDKARIHSIKDARSIERHVSPRMLRNAIHAAVAGSDSDTSQAVNLTDLLKRERVRSRILVAEDNETNQTIIRELLETAGHTVFIASDGEQALDVYEREAPDIAILDFNMPLRTGCEVIQAIRLMEPTGVRMPAIILSASVTPDSRERATKAGADEFVGKPFDASTLLQTLDKLAERLPATRSISRIDGRGLIPSTKRVSTARRIDYELAYLDAGRVAELEDIARDTQFVAELMRGFKGDSERLLANLRHELSQRNLQELRDITHALKGAAVGVGASKLGAAINELEAAISDDHGSLEPLFQSLQDCYTRTVQELDNYLREKHRVSL